MFHFQIVLVTAIITTIYFTVFHDKVRDLIWWHILKKDLNNPKRSVIHTIPILYSNLNDLSVSQLDYILEGTTKQISEGLYGECTPTLSNIERYAECNPKYAMLKILRIDKIGNQYFARARCIRDPILNDSGKVLIPRVYRIDDEFKVVALDLYFTSE